MIDAIVSLYFIRNKKLAIINKGINYDAQKYNRKC
jgi:hypothetical protein